MPRAPGRPPQFNRTKLGGQDPGGRYFGQRSSSPQRRRRNVHPGDWVEPSGWPDHPFGDDGHPFADAFADESPRRHSQQQQQELNEGEHMLVPHAGAGWEGPGQEHCEGQQGLEPLHVYRLHQDAPYAVTVFCTVGAGLSATGVGITASQQVLPFILVSCLSLLVTSLCLLRPVLVIVLPASLSL